jgi:gluconate 2-dehydrogenase gamma chain
MNNMSDNISRRTVFQIIGATPAVAAALASESAVAETHDHAHMAAAAASSASSGPYKRQAFDDHQWATVNVVCDLIIPADEQSGSASQAGVPEFLDDWLAFRAEQDGNLDLTAKIFGGLMWLDRQANDAAGKNFIDIPVDQQKKILDRIAYPGKAAPEDETFVHFFTELRTLTVTGFFSSKVGVAYLPYLGNVAVEEWKGCDPKVWAVIEDRLKNGYHGIVPSVA